MGANLYFHYCMDKLVAKGLGHEKIKADICPYCGMTKSNAANHCNKQSKGCCHDEHKLIKIEKDQKASDDTGLNISKPVFIVSLQSSFRFPAPTINSPFLQYSSAHIPPETSDVSLFVLNCIFRI